MQGEKKNSQMTKWTLIYLFLEIIFRFRNNAIIHCMLRLLLIDFPCDFSHIDNEHFMDNKCLLNSSVSQLVRYAHGFLISNWNKYILLSSSSSFFFNCKQFMQHNQFVKITNRNYYVSVSVPITDAVDAVLPNSIIQTIVIISRNFLLVFCL